MPQTCTLQRPHAFDLVCLVCLNSPARYNGKHREVCLGVSLLVHMEQVSRLVWSWFVRRRPVTDMSPLCGLQAGRCRLKNTPLLCTGEIKPEGFVRLTVCLSGAVRRVTKHVVTAVLVVSAG